MRFQSLGGHLLFFLMSSFACFNMLKVSFELWPVLDSWLDKNKIEVNYDLKSVFFLWQKGQKIIISLVNLRLLKVLDELHNSLHLVQQRSTMGLSQSSLSEQLLPLRSDTFYNFFLKKPTLLHSPRSVIGQLWVRGLNFSLSSFFFFFSRHHCLFFYHCSCEHQSAATLWMSSRRDRVCATCVLFPYLKQKGRLFTPLFIRGRSETTKHFLTIIWRVRTTRLTNKFLFNHMRPSQEIH